MRLRRLTQNLGMALLLALVVAAGATLGAPHQVASAVREVLAPLLRSRAQACSTLETPPQRLTGRQRMLITEEMPIELPASDLPAHQPHFPLPSSGMGS
jgi:hypothetical protein